MKSGATAPHSKRWPQFPSSIRACVLECPCAPALWIQHSRPELVTRGGFSLARKCSHSTSQQPHLHSQEFFVRAPPPWPTSPVSCRRDRRGIGSGDGNCMASTANPHARLTRAFGTARCEPDLLDQIR